VLDDLYESLESAWSEALSWWREVAPEQEPIGIGVEVSTASGDWRTLRHPCS
jgi:sugar phosphate isomerase/epimerase